MEDDTVVEVPQADAEDVKFNPKLMAEIADDTQKYNNEYFGQGLFDDITGPITGYNRVRILNTARHIRSKLRMGKDEPFTIVDWGCGNGRYFEIAEELAKEGVKVNFIALDIAKAPLEQFEKRVKEKGFKLQEGEGSKLRDVAENNPEDMGYQGPVYKKGNITLKLVHGKVTDSPEHTKTLLPEKNNLILGMFGTLAYVVGRENRVSILKMFGEITEGQMLFAVPNRMCDEENLKKYEKMREEGRPYKAAREPGDVYYERMLPNGEMVSMFMHLYTCREFEQELGAAGLLKSISCANTKSEHKLTKSAPLYMQLMEEQEAKSLASAEELDKGAFYFWGTAHTLEMYRHHRFNVGSPYLIANERLR